MSKKEQKFNFKHNNIIRGVDGGKTESFLRPNHFDFMDSSELKRAEWTGVRQNSISREWEFWIVGEIKVRVPEAEAFPAKLKQVHMDLFGLRGDRFDGLTEKTVKPS
jgi:hypothetical protein